MADPDKCAICGDSYQNETEKKFKIHEACAEPTYQMQIGEIGGAEAFHRKKREWQKRKHNMSRTMQADEVTQHQPEVTVRPPDGEHMTEEEYEEFKKFKEETDNRADAKFALGRLPPNVLKSYLTSAQGAMYLLLSNVDLDIPKKNQLWNELSVVFGMLDAEIVQQFHLKASGHQ